MTDRLSEIITPITAFLWFPPRLREEMVAEAGSVPAARRLALQRLPEAARIELVRRAGMVPPAAEGDIIEAPARGPVRTFMPHGMYPDGKGGSVPKPAGYMGRMALQLADGADLMALDGPQKRSGAALTPAQVQVGRAYAALVERYEAGALRGSSYKARGRGAGKGGDVSEARLADRERLIRLRARIGDRPAMQVRRIRPSLRGDGQEVVRVTITDRALVDSVFLAGHTVSKVLRAHGWAVKGDHVKTLTKALADALDRMAGPAPRKTRHVAHYGPRPVWDTGSEEGA